MTSIQFSKTTFNMHVDKFYVAEYLFLMKIACNIHILFKVCLFGLFNIGKILLLEILNHTWIKAIFDLSLPPVVCRRAYCCLYLFAYIGVQHFVLSYVFSLCFDVRYNFHIKMMFGSSLPLAVCRRWTCRIYVIWVCLRKVVSNRS